MYRAPRRILIDGVVRKQLLCDGSAGVEQAGTDDDDVADDDGLPAGSFLRRMAILAAFTLPAALSCQSDFSALFRDSSTRSSSSLVRA